MATKNFDGWSYEAIKAYKAAINLKRRLKRQQKKRLREYWYGKEDKNKIKGLKTIRIRSPKLKDTSNRILLRKQRELKESKPKEAKKLEVQRRADFIMKLQQRMLDKKK